MNIFKNNKFIVFIVCFFLFVIPFFWLKPGEMDLGGDATRLYFYDPLNYLKNLVLYVVFPEGQGIEYSYHFAFPFVFILWFLKSVFKSPYFLISIFNGLSLAGAFLSVYGIVVELLKFGNNKLKDNKLIRISAMFTGLFYIFLPMSMGGGWERALFSQMQVFLNPFIFWLFLRFIHTTKIYYLLIALLTAFVFSPNFSYSSAPKFFAFYTIALVYLGIYSLILIKKKLKLKFLMLTLFLFILMQSFHLIPQVLNLFQSNTLVNSKVFSSQQRNADISFFIGTSTYARVAHSLLGGLSSYFSKLFVVNYFFFIFPAIIIIGAILNRKIKIFGIQKTTNYLLIFIFFLITFFLDTAKITDLGFSFYISLFAIPGFTMFRSYAGQFVYVFAFFYSLLFGYSLFYILVLSKYFKKLFLIFIFLLIFVNAWPFIKGDVINLAITKTPKGEDVKIPIVMDSKYEKTLDFIRKNPLDVKIFTLPLVDHFYQIVAGTNNGAYMGPSTVSYLSGKKDFGSSAVLNPFTGFLLQSVKDKDYKTINNLFPILNIKYVFYNSDPRIYDYFPYFPYQEMRQFMPSDQKSYQDFVNRLDISKVIDFGDKYHIYKVNDSLFLPHIYVAKEPVYFDQSATDSASFVMLNFIKDDNRELRKVFIDKKEHFDFQKNKIPKIVFTKINPTKYKIQVINAKDPYILVFSEAFNKNWKLFLSNSSKNLEENKTIVADYFNDDIKESSHENIFLDKSTFETWGKDYISDKKHFLVNVYANAWYIKPSDVGDKKEYTLILEEISQRTFYVGLFISILAFTVCLSWLIMIVFNTIKYKK